MMILAKIIIIFIIIMQQYQYFLDSFNEILLNSFPPCASRGEILFPLRSALLLSELNNEGTHFISNTRPFVSTRQIRQEKNEKSSVFNNFFFFSRSNERINSVSMYFLNKSKKYCFKGPRFEPCHLTHYNLHREFLSVILILARETKINKNQLF